MLVGSLFQDETIENSRKPDLCKGKSPPVPSLLMVIGKGEDRKRQDRYSLNLSERNIKLNRLFTSKHGSVIMIDYILTFRERGEGILYNQYLGCKASKVPTLGLMRLTHRATVENKDSQTRNLRRESGAYIRENEVLGNQQHSYITRI